jgi:hypothetical protein
MGGKLLWYLRSWYSIEILVNVLVDMLFICSFQRSFQSKVVPIYFMFLDQGTEWLNNFNSRRCLCEHWVKSTAIVFASEE